MPSVWDEIMEYTRLYQQVIAKFGGSPGPSASQIDSFQNATPEQRERTLRYMQRHVNE